MLSRPLERELKPMPDAPGGAQAVPSSAMAGGSPYVRRASSPRLEALGITGLQAALLAFMLVALILPVGAVLLRAIQDPAGNLAGLAPLQRALDIPGFGAMLWRSVAVALTTTLLAVPLAYAFAYGLAQTCMPGKKLWRALALVPLLAPSLLPGISLVYLGGNQGLLRDWVGPGSVYGFWGIVVGEAFYIFPHLLMVLTSSLALSDARLHDAARSMGAGPLRTFATVTLPGTRHAVFAASCLAFTLVITDFGVPKVVGGDYGVLAVEVYKAVVGQQNFPRGAAFAMLLLVPALLTFAADTWLRRRQHSFLDGRIQPYQPQPSRWRDSGFMVFALLVCLLLLVIAGTAVWASFIRMWPYNLSLSLRSYDFANMDGGGWLAWRNSVQLGFWTALLGTLTVFLGAWLTERLKPLGRTARSGISLLRAAALLPMAVPGMVLGLGYIFFFNHPANPLNGLYGTMGLLVLCTVAHFYTSAHLASTSALGRLDPEFESVSASLGVARLRTGLRVVFPMCLPTALDVGRYLFVSAMTTVSAVVFLYRPDTVLASVAVLNMDDAGFPGAAAAMCTLIMATSAAVSLLLYGASRAVMSRTQAWRRPVAE